MGLMSPVRGPSATQMVAYKTCDMVSKICLVCLIAFTILFWTASCIANVYDRFPREKFNTLSFYGALLFPALCLLGVCARELALKYEPDEHPD